MQNFFYQDLDTKYPSQAHCPEQRYSPPPLFFCHQVSTSLVKIFNRTVREQDAVIDADAIRRGEGGGETQKGKNPIRNGTLWRSREKERRRWLKLPRSNALLVFKTLSQNQKSSDNTYKADSLKMTAFPSPNGDIFVTRVKYIPLATFLRDATFIVSPQAYRVLLLYV